ncbi:MAG TPA: hypothetical protein VEW71_01110 [Allosphingosinicella sp.]|nr:hypothetical protein [Allosphingosinicella sp.]
MNELLDFTKPIDEAITDLVEAQGDLVAATGTYNHSIDETRLGLENYTDVPCCIYFYYVRINSNGRLFVTHHFFPGGDPNDHGNPPSGTDWHAIARNPSLLTPILEMLAQDARPLGAGQFPPIGTDFQNVKWCRKSYLAFFIDEASWTLRSTNGVRFPIDKDGVPGTPNHSFYDALPLPLTMPIRRPLPGGPYTDERSALVCINHMKADVAGRDIGRDANGNPLPGPWPTEQQLFHFEMVFDVLFENGTRGMMVILDPDGTNMGPPVPPPA